MLLKKIMDRKKKIWKNFMIGELSVVLEQMFERVGILLVSTAI